MSKFPTTIMSVGIIAEHGVVVSKHGIVANRRGIVAELGIDVTEHAPNGVATSPRIASLPEHSVVVAVAAVRASSSVGSSPNGVGLSPSGMASSPERGVVIIIVATISGSVTMK